MSRLSSTATQRPLTILSGQTTTMGLLGNIFIEHAVMSVMVRRESGLGSAQPWMTLAVDSVTGRIIGFHAHFEKPCDATAQRCLENALLRNEQAEARRCLRPGERLAQPVSRNTGAKLNGHLQRVVSRSAPRRP